MLTKEELRKGLEDSNPTMPDQEIDRKIEAWVENVHGTEEKYQVNLVKQAQEVEDRLAISERVGVSNDDIESYENQLDLTGQYNTDAASEIELRKMAYVNQGKTKAEAEALATVDVRKDFAMQGKTVYESVSVDKEIKELSTKYPDIADLKNEIKAVAQAKGMSTLAAYREVRENKARREVEYEKWDDAERNFYANLTQNDRLALEGLKAVQPDANWAPSKYYSYIYGNKPLKNEAPEVASRRKARAIDAFKNSYPWQDFGLDEEDLDGLVFDKDGKVMFDDGGLPLIDEKYIEKMRRQNDELRKKLAR